MPDSDRPSLAATPEQAGEPTIEAMDLSKWYGDVVAVSGVSFQVFPGVTALLGPNGAGKSTVLKMIAGLIRPSAGRVTVFGETLRADPGLFSRIGLVAEQESLYPQLSGREFVRLNARLQHVRNPNAATTRALEIVGLEDAADRLTGGYSKGMRQRAKIAAAVVHDPDLLIMDEPLTGTDPVQRLDLIKLIRGLGEAGKTVVVSSHVLPEVERFASRILVIVGGKLAAAGDFHAIRDRIDTHARRVRLRVSDNRRLAETLVRQPEVTGVMLDPDGQSLVIETSGARAIYRAVPKLARETGVHLYEVTALDESLASVFAYVTER